MNKKWLVFIGGILLAGGLSTHLASLHGGAEESTGNDGGINHPRNL